MRSSPSDFDIRRLLSRTPASTLSAIDIVGNGFAPLEHHADLAAHQHRVDAGRVEVVAVDDDLALARGAPGITSCMRFSVRRKVDLPQPDGPMKRRHRAGLDRDRDALDGEEVAVVDVEVVDLDALGHWCSVSSG